MDRSQVIFGNVIDKKTIRKGNKSKAKYIDKFGDETGKVFHLQATNNATLFDAMNIKDLSLGTKKMKFDDKAIIIGNIRMGFGHYRISIAMASCAHALGYTPYWLDYNSFDTTGGKMIRHQNDLYSFGSRLSQKSKLFNKFFWEPMNSEGFRKLTYNSIDQKNAELLAPLCQDLPRDIPYIATHVWPSQAAVHEGLTHVVNAIPDNWPMALHLSEGAIHTVQTPFAFLGYKKLNGMAKNELKPMPDGVLYEVGHYIDHEIVSTLKEDTKARLDRLHNSSPLRFLMTVGGAGAQYNIFKEIILFLIPYIKENKVVLFINFGDHKNVYEQLNNEIKEYALLSTNYFDSWSEFKALASSLESIKGIYSIYHKDIFEAVYSTNILMPKCDLMLTKPSELAYYPIPKLMIQRVGGHEAYGAIHASEIGDGTFECDSSSEINSMIKLILSSNEVLEEMNHRILKLNEEGMYNGAYRCVELAVNKKITTK